MALSGPFQIATTGLTLTAAYLRVQRVELIVAPGSKAANVALAVYASQEARQSGKEPVTTAYWQCSGEQYDQYFALATLDTSNPVRQAYLWLKTLDQYSGYQDV